MDLEDEENEEKPTTETQKKEKEEKKPEGKEKQTEDKVYSHQYLVDTFFLFLILNLWHFSCLLKYRR